MRMCQEHWVLCNATAIEYGLGSLISPSSEVAVARMVEELEGGDLKTTFDPLMALNNHFTCEAIKCGGLEAMTLTGPPENDGHHCPICLFVNNAPDFNAAAALSLIAKQMAAWAREEGLIPKVN